MTPRIALVGDYRPEVVAHQAIPVALARAAEFAGHELAWEWVATPRLGTGAARELAAFHAIWCVPGSPYASTEGALAAIRFARETKRPFLGTCGGYQHALIEYAQAHWGIEHPIHAELDPTASDPLISPLACSLVGEKGELSLTARSRLAEIYGATTAVEAYHCRYGLNPRYAARLDSGLLRVAARDANGEVRAVELAGHPFFIATLFQPERAALEGRAHPLIGAYVAAARAA